MRGEQVKTFCERFQGKSMYPKLKKKSNASKTETKKQSNMKSHVMTNKAGGLVLLLKKNPSFDLGYNSVVVS